MPSQGTKTAGALVGGDMVSTNTGWAKAKTHTVNTCIGQSRASTDTSGTFVCTNTGGASIVVDAVNAGITDSLVAVGVADMGTCG